MAKTLLNAVNEVLKKVGMIHGDSEALTTLSRSAIQRSIDIAIQVINEGIDDLYTTSGVPLPNMQDESTITLVTGTRSYALASTLVRLQDEPMVDQTNNQYLEPYPGGYNQMLIDDPERDDTGLPQYYAIKATNGQIYLDRAPTSVENGRIYTYQFDKDLVLTVLGDTVPFKDIVFRAMVPVWALLWQRERRGAKAFDPALYKKRMGTASGLLRQVTPRTSYNNKR